MAAAFQTISVAPLIGTSWGWTREDGDRVFEAIAPFITDGQMVVLDFIGVDKFSNPFFFHAIGQLYESLPIERVRELLIVEGLSQHHREVLECVEEEAQEYFKDPESFEAAYRKVMEDS